MSTTCRQGNYSFDINEFRSTISPFSLMEKNKMLASQEDKSNVSRLGNHLTFIFTFSPWMIHFLFLKEFSILIHIPPSLTSMEKVNYFLHNLSKPISQIDSPWVHTTILLKTLCKTTNPSWSRETILPQTCTSSWSKWGRNNSQLLLETLKSIVTGRIFVKMSTNCSFISTYSNFTSFSIIFSPRNDIWLQNTFYLSTLPNYLECL